jgi:hypothetical protein
VSDKKRVSVGDGKFGIGESGAGDKPKREIAGNGNNPAAACGDEPGVRSGVADQPWKLVPLEVPRSEWPNFFAGVSRFHQGWPVSLHVLEAKGRIRNNWKTRQFAEIGLATRNGGKAPISIVLTDPRKKFTRTIAAPVRVWFLDMLGADAVIAIEAGQQSVVMLRFHSPEGAGVFGHKSPHSFPS